MFTEASLERFRDFVDPDQTGITYDPKKGLERLMGVLSPDPKGIVLAAMGNDWYLGSSQLYSKIASWLTELGLPQSIWPLNRASAWSYLRRQDIKTREWQDGSLVIQGALVKKIDINPSQVMFQRSLAGTELMLPMVQQAIEFVREAGKYGQQQKQQGKEPPKYDSMWKIISAVNSTTDQKRPLAVFDVFAFLAKNPGKYRQVDIEIALSMSEKRLADILPNLGRCGVIDYVSHGLEKNGQPATGWSVYTLPNKHSVIDLDAQDLFYQKQEHARGLGRKFTNKNDFLKTVDYVITNPDIEYEYQGISKKLTLHPPAVSATLSFLADLNILNRPEPGFKSGEKLAVISANGLSKIFYDLICEPAKETADSLSPLPLRPWNRKDVAIYLQNYNEERSHRGIEGAEEVRGLLLEILSGVGGDVMKKSHIDDLFNERSETELKGPSLRHQLRSLMDIGLVEQPKPGYYRRMPTKPAI